MSLNHLIRQKGAFGWDAHTLGRAHVAFKKNQTLPLLQRAVIAAGGHKRVLVEHVLGVLSHSSCLPWPSGSVCEGDAHSEGLRDARRSCRGRLLVKAPPH